MSNQKAFYPKTLTSYHTSILWLSLEPFHNAGMTPAQTRYVIEGVADPGSSFGAKVRCECQGINGNWNVRTMLIDHGAIRWLTIRIEMALNKALQRHLAGEVLQEYDIN